MLKPKTIEFTVMYFEFFNDKNFLSAVWSATKSLSLVNRIITIGAVSGFEKQHGTVEQGIYTLKLKISRNPFGTVSLNIRPGV